MTATTLEMGLQELEALEAPGFWTGFAIGAGVAGAGLYLGAAALVAT